MALEHDPEKWIPVFRKDHAPNKRIERDGDSKKRYHALRDWMSFTTARPFVTARLAVTALAVIGSAPVASGQSLLPGQRLSVEVVGGTLDLPSSSGGLPKMGGTIFAQRQKDSVGKPCLSVAPITRKQVINPNIYDHILLLDNNCGQEIRILACYYKTDSCKTLSIGGYKRQQQLLGVFPASDFRFSFREYVR